MQKKKKLEKKEETLTEKMTLSPNERHTQTHGSLTETFQRSQISFLINRELMCVNTQ